MIVARDEAAMLPGCMARLGFADEVVVLVDDRTTDATASVASRAGARVETFEFSTFSEAKNRGIERSARAWTLVLDADERVSQRLAHEILRATADSAAHGFRIPIRNYFLGRAMAHGGWTSERPVRLFRTGAARFVGDIHERLEFSHPAPRLADLRTPIEHFSHRSIVDNLHKTAEFGDVAAREMLKEGHRVVRGRTLLWAGGRELFGRLVLRSGWRDGMPGMTEAVYQALSTVCVLARLWELQQRPSIEEHYHRLEHLTR